MRKKKNHRISQGLNGVIVLDIGTPTYPGETMLIDLEDAEWLEENAGRCRMGNKGYPVCKYRGENVTVHRLIMPNTDCVDHINHETTDNRRDNLRSVTSRQNSQNLRLKRNCSSKYPGVSYHKTSKKWRARIKITTTIGSFDSEEEAAKAYRDKVASLGEVMLDEMPNQSTKGMRDE